MAQESATVSIEMDGDSDEFEIPLALTEALSEDEESSAEVVGNLALQDWHSRPTASSTTATAMSARHSKPQRRQPWTSSKSGSARASRR
ncbi:DUF7545 family protein [Halovenus salina]|uniref:Uncharacterized protein n=1 Tax=Halovenus salina TaxID=1510225 RepID=A0ABD5W7Q9_9EURY